MSQCKIYLENYTGIYRAGCEIRGRVECFLDGETRVRSIKIRLKCKEHSGWNVPEEFDVDDGKFVDLGLEAYTGDNDVTRLEEVLCGSDLGSVTLPGGMHVYPFTFLLAKNLPSTFNGLCGTIMYQIKAIVDQSLHGVCEDKIMVIVASPIDLNELPDDAFQEAAYTDEKTICCWCCEGGNVRLDVVVSKRAFVPGEVVEFKVVLDNRSNRKVKGLKVTFDKAIKYKVTYPCYTSKKIIENMMTLNEHGVGPHEKRTYSVRMTIPERLEAPNFSSCTLLEVSYPLQVIAKMPKFSMDLNVAIHPVVGNIQRRPVGVFDGSLSLEEVRRQISRSTSSIAASVASRTEELSDIREDASSIKSTLFEAPELP